MITGMTGFGHGEAQAPGLRVTVDIRTVNHRFLDVELRGAALPGALEAVLRKRVEDVLSRGKVDVSLALAAEEGETSGVRVNRAAMHALIASLREFGRELGLPDEVSLTHIASLPWTRVIEVGTVDIGADHALAVEQALLRALDGVVATRRREGDDLARDFKERIALVKTRLSGVREGSHGAAEAHATRLRLRMSELLSGHSMDDGRIAQEAALLADRSDVTEEITRLGAFLERIDEIVDGSGPAGKRMDFTLQEAFREVNTIGSKTRSLDVSGLVIDMKTELERMREQVANVE